MPLGVEELLLVLALLEVQARLEDLLEELPYGLVGEGPGVFGGEVGEHLLFPLGVVVGKAELRLEAADLLHEPPALGEEAQDLPVHPVHLFAEGLDALVHSLFYGPPALRVSSGLLGPLPFREAGHQDGDPVEDEEGAAHDEEGDHVHRGGDDRGQGEEEDDGDAPVAGEEGGGEDPQAGEEVAHHRHLKDHPHDGEHHEDLAHVAADGDLGGDHVPQEAQEEGDGEGQEGVVGEERPQGEAEPRPQEEGHGQALLVLIEPRGDEGPDLVDDEGKGEHKPPEGGHLQGDEEGLGDVQDDEVDLDAVGLGREVQGPLQPLQKLDPEGPGHARPHRPGEEGPEDPGAELLEVLYQGGFLQALGSSLAS